MNEIHLYYDDEGDYLEIQLGPYNDAYFEEIDGGICHIIDTKTKQITGISILGFKELTIKRKNLQLPFPHIHKNDKISLYFNDKEDYFEMRIGKNNGNFQHVKKGIFVSEDGLAVGIAGFKKKTEKDELAIPISEKIELTH